MFSGIKLGKILTAWFRFYTVTMNMLKRPRQEETEDLSSEVGSASESEEYESSSVEEDLPVSTGVFLLIPNMCYCLTVNRVLSSEDFDSCFSIYI